MIIYMAHRIMPRIEDVLPSYRSLTLSTEHFESFLAARRDELALPLETLATRKSVPENAFALTFDDGYKDNLVHALPLLETYKVPATIFVISGCIDGVLEPFEIMVGRTLEAAGRSELWEEKRKTLKHGPFERRMSRLQDIADEVGGQVHPPVRDDFLSWDDIRTLAEHPLITIGGHTHTHALMTRLDPLTLLAEIRTNKQRIEEEIGKRITCFSYPYGGNHIGTQLAVKMSGYRLACSTRPAPVGTKKNFFALPRMEIRQGPVSAHT